MIIVGVPLSGQLSGRAGFDVVDTKGHRGDRVLFSKWNSFSRIGVYDRASLRLIASAFLFGGFTSRGFIDPQIQWDEQAQRWFYLGIGPPTQDFNFTLSYGWSKSADPSDVDTQDGTSGWCQYLLPSTTTRGAFLIDDYPKLGHSDNHLIFGSNMFSGPFLSFDHGARIWAVPKPTNGDRTCPPPPAATSFGSQFDPLKTADGHRAATPVPANTIDATPNGYVVAADNPFIVNTGGSASQIMAWHVSGPRESPVLVEDGNMNVRDVPVLTSPSEGAGGFAALDAILEERLQSEAENLYDETLRRMERVFFAHRIHDVGPSRSDRRRPSGPLWQQH